jgi:hypothetical protein
MVPKEQFIKGHYGAGPLYFWDKNKTWQELSVPQDIVDDQPKVEGDTERNWQYLVREFVKDISGEKFLPYQSFKEGSRYQQFIDLIRKNDNWTDVTHLQ